LRLVPGHRGLLDSVFYDADLPSGREPRTALVLLVIALRASGGSGAHAEAARQVVLAVLFAQLLAAAQHDGPPHAAPRAPRQVPARRSRRPPIEALSGRRPRG
jgi:hypothetical protein